MYHPIVYSRMTVGLTIGCCVMAAAAATSIGERVDAVFAPVASSKAPGCAVLVRESDKAAVERGYGVRDLRTMARIDRDTDFRLASFTKQFTAMAIMLLMRDGKLRYDQPLTDVFPEFPEWGRTVTIRHLLTHTGGLPDYEDLMSPEWTSERQIQDADVLRLIEQQARPKFAAGTSWSYSNSAYVLLGLIVAKVSGATFGDFLHDRIFEPLRMKNTLVYVKGRNTVPNRAFGYGREDSAFREADQSPTSATLGDGGIYSNIADLAKWDDALSRHTLLSEGEMKVALTPVRLNGGSEPHWPVTPGDDNLAPGKPVSYGFGWFLDPYEGQERMWHTGTTTGFRTAIERFPNDRATVIVLCNRTDADAAKLALDTVRTAGFGTP